MRSCSPTPTPPKPPNSTTRIDTVWTKGKDSIVYKPIIKKYIVRDTVYKDIDTLAVLKDYFAKVVYEDTIRLDTFGYVLIKDTISENRVQSRTSVANYRFPTITKTITNNITIPPKNQIYIGFDIIGNKAQPINYFGPSVLLKTKKDQIYTIGAGLTPDGLGGKFGTLWKIKIKPN